jgi:predicted Zn-dependent protease
MDCRWTFCVAAALLSSAAGCVHSLLPDPDPVAKAAADEKEKEKDKDKDAKTIWIVQTKLKPETLVSYGDLKATSAVQPETTPGERERYLEQARESYEKALKEDPNFVPAHLALARLLAVTNNHPAALVHYRKVLELHPKDKEVWAEVSTFHARAREWDAAVGCQRRALALDPDNQLYTKRLGMHLGMAGHYDESFACLRPVVGEAKAHCLVAHCLVAQMLHQAGQDDTARQHVDLALQGDPELQSARELLAELNGGAPAAATVVTEAAE